MPRTVNPVFSVNPAASPTATRPGRVRSWTIDCPPSATRWHPYSSSSPPLRNGSIAGWFRKRSCRSDDVSPRSAKSSSLRTTPIEMESMFVYMNPPPATPLVQSPTTAYAAPSFPVKLNRSSITSRDNRMTDLTPTARCFAGSFALMPASWQMKEFTPSAATTTRQRISSSPALMPTNWSPFLMSESTFTPGNRVTPASSHLPPSHSSSLARSTVTAFTGSASRWSR